MALFLFLTLAFSVARAASADDGLDLWKLRHSTPQGSNLSSIAYGNNTFVAVGDGGSVLTSPDGISWTPRSAGASIGSLHGIIFAGNQFVAVGDGNGGLILTSPDGLTWTSRTTGIDPTLGSRSLVAIAYGRNEYVVVGQSGAILTSPDGVTWTSRDSHTSENYASVTFGNGVFVAVSTPHPVVVSGGGGIGGGVIVITGPVQPSPPPSMTGALSTSSDGVRWETTDSSPDGNSHALSLVTFGNSEFMAAATYDAFFASSDGKHWVQRSGPPLMNYTIGLGGVYHYFTPTFHGIAGIGFANNQFIALNTKGWIVTSPDGINWIERNGGQQSSQHNDFPWSFDNGGDTWTVSGSDGGPWAISNGVASSGNLTNGTPLTLTSSEGGILTIEGQNNYVYPDSGLPFSTLLAGTVFTLVVTDAATIPDSGIIVITTSGTDVITTTGTYQFTNVLNVETGSSSPQLVTTWTITSGITTYDLSAVAYGNNTLVAAGSSSAILQSGTLPLVYTFDSSANPLNGGFAGSAGTLPPGSSGTINASPSTGYTFLNWTESGTVVSTDATYSFTLDGNKNFVANFGVPLIVQAGSGGTVTGSGTFIVGSSQQISATANDGWMFTGWNDGVVANPRTVQVQASNPTYAANFSTAPAPAKMQLTTGGTLTSPQVNFTWAAGNGASQYALWVGSSPGGYDLYSAVENSKLSQSLTLPTDGRPVYVRLWSMIDGVWNYKDYSYITSANSTGPLKAQLTSPTPGSSLNSASVTFNWNAGRNVSQYALWIGSKPGAYNLYSGIEASSKLSQSVTLATGGGEVYVRLFSMINGAWSFNDYVYTAPDGTAHLLSPADGTALTSPSPTFQWSQATGASQYFLTVGSQPNTFDIYAALQGNSLSKTLALPPNGHPVYVRIWSMLNGAWDFNYYSYTLFDGKAAMISYLDGDTLPSQANFSWSAGTGASQYALWVGSSPGGYDLYAGVEGTHLSRNVSIPSDGRPVYVRLYSMINGSWEYNSYVYDTAAPTSGSRKAQMLTPGNTASLASSSVGFNWDFGSNVSQYALWIGSSPGSYNLYAGLEGGSTARTVNIPADGGPVYVRLFSMINGAWGFNDYMYTAMDGRAEMISSAGQTFTSSTPTLVWTPGTGVSQYALWVGSSPGGYDLYYAVEGNRTSRTLTLPADGELIYVRLYSMINGKWVFNDYTYRAAKPQ